MSLSELLTGPLEAEIARLRDERWWQAYLAALTGLAARTDLFGPGHAAGVDTLAREMADAAVPRRAES